MGLGYLLRVLGLFVAVDDEKLHKCCMAKIDTSTPRAQCDQLPNKPLGKSTKIAYNE